MGSAMFGPKLNANVTGSAAARSTNGKAADCFDVDSKMMMSSPTSTLAADLSKNFHIDKTCVSLLFLPLLLTC